MGGGEFISGGDDAYTGLVGVKGGRGIGIWGQSSFKEAAAPEDVVTADVEAAISLGFFFDGGQGFIFEGRLKVEVNTFRFSTFL